MNSDNDIDDTATSAFSTNKQNAQIVLTIPPQIIRDEMLEQLGLPAAEYRHKTYEDHKTCVTVLFHTSRRSRPGTLIPMTISGVRSMDVAVAEHTAAEAAFRYVESATNTTVKDLNYGRLKQLERENEYLRNKLKEASVRSEKLARGWFLSVRHMSSFSEQVHNMAILSYFGGQEVLTDSMKGAFANIERLSERFKSIGAYLEAKLGKVLSLLR